MSSRRFLIWMHSRAVPQWSIPAESIARIRTELDSGWELVSLEVPAQAAGDGPATVPAEVIEAIAEAEVYCGFGIRREAFVAASRLRWYHSGAAGVGGSLFPELLESDVLFTNSAGVHAEPMADHALAMMLHFARGFDIATRAQGRGEWAHPALTGPDSPVLRGGGELAGKTLGIVGYGGIGSALGRRAHALGMRVRAIRRTPGALPAELESVGGPEDLPNLLRSSDYVAITVPETADTRKLIGPEELGLLPPTAVLVNLARGGIVDEDALVEALMERRLRGAGLDVFQREPLAADHPLWKLDNVLITPHVSSTTGRFWERETDLIVRNIRRYLAGEELENRVDKERGY